MPSPAKQVQFVPLEHVSVLNPRTRNRRLHKEIVDSIDTVGLKRPITVRRRRGPDGEPRYDAVCGEGRLEAFRLLGQSTIPVVVVDGSEADCLVMSLVENVARRAHRPIDLMQEIGNLHARGYSDAEIGKKIGVTASWVGMIVTLLEKGEERLVAAVESGLIPISFAIDIARASDADDQRVLAEAYADGRIRGKKIGAVRRMLEQRARRSRGLPDNGFGVRGPHRKLTPDELMRLYQREADKHRILIKKADFAQSRLLFVIEALRELLSDDHFITLLDAEGLKTFPRSIDERIQGRQPE